MAEVKVPVIYRCDPTKAVGCRKSSCFYDKKTGSCYGTLKEEWAVLDKIGDPIVIFPVQAPPPEKRPWYETPPPEWYRKMGRYGVWVNLAISIIALIVAILKLR